MMRRLMTSALLYSLSLVGTEAGYSWTQQSAACARMGDASNVYPDTSAGFRWKFDLKIAFPLSEGVDFLDKRIKLEWRNPLTIEKLEPQGAVRAIGGGANWIEVEPSPQYIGHAQFSIVGSRMSGKHEDLVGPTITCSSDSDVPPPSPPKRQPDCELMPEVEAYPLGATREAGSDITIKLTRWTPLRIFTLTYFGQEGILVSKPNGITWVDSPHSVGDDSLITFSFTLDPTPGDGLRCEGHVACIEFEAKPSPHHKPHIVCLQSPPPVPPESPMVPPPPLSSPPRISPPAKLPASSIVSASSLCELGASAEVRKISQHDALSEVLIVVTLRTWIEGDIVTLDIIGNHLQVAQAVRAELSEDFSEKLADYAFSFRLHEKPTDLIAFVVVLRGEAFDGIMSVRCAKHQDLAMSPPSPQPPPSPHPIYSLAEAKYADHALNEPESYGSTSEDGDATASYGAIFLPSSEKPDDPSMPESTPRAGEQSALSLFIIFSAIGAIFLFAYRSGKFDGFLRNSTSLPVDGSDDKYVGEPIDIINGNLYCRSSGGDMAHVKPTGEDDYEHSYI